MNATEYLPDDSAAIRPLLGDEIASLPGAQQCDAALRADERDRDDSPP